MSSPALLALTAPDATSLAALADRAQHDAPRVIIDGRRPPSSDPVDWVDADTADVVAASLRAAGLPTSLELWCEQPGAARVVALLRARPVVAAGGSVALLCGDVEGLIDVVSAAAAMLRLIDAAGDPGWAGLRDADGPVQVALRSVVDLLESDAAQAWVAAAADDEAIAAVAIAALSGIRVGYVEVASHARDDLLPSSPPLRAATAGVEHVGDGFVLHVPLEGWATARARVGRQRGDFVIDVEGRRRRLALPPVLQRCIPTDAVRTASGLRVTFVRDPAVWPARDDAAREPAA